MFHRGNITQHFGFTQVWKDLMVHEVSVSHSEASMCIVEQITDFNSQLLLPQIKCNLN